MIKIQKYLIYTRVKIRIVKMITLRIRSIKNEGMLMVIIIIIMIIIILLLLLLLLIIIIIII